MSEDTIDPLLFEHEMVNVTRTLARGEKLQVKIQGSHAYAQDGTVVLPAIDRTKRLSIRDVRVARGFVDHEAKHQRSTDMDGKWLEKAKKHSRFAESMLQSVEDIRIERHQIAEYQGAKVNLETTADMVLEMFNERHDAGKIEVKDQNQLLPMALAIAGRKLLDYTMHDEAIGKLRKLCGEKVWAFAEGLAKKAVGLQDGKEGTKDSYELAMWAVNNPPDPEEPEEPGGKNVGEGKGEGKGEGTGAGAGAGAGEGSKGKGDKAGDKAGDAPAKGAGTDGRDLPEWTENPVYLDSKDAVNEALAQKVDGNWQQPYVSDWEKDYLTTREGRWVDGTKLPSPLTDTGRMDFGRMTYREQSKDVAQVIGSVKAKFERKLAVMVNRSWERGLTSGELDRKRLTQAFTGNQNVYRKRDGVPEIDACVSILVDLSGSMSGNPIRMASAACIAIAESLNKMNVPFEITGHRAGGMWPEASELQNFVYSSEAEKEWNAGKYKSVEGLVQPVFVNGRVDVKKSAFSVTRWTRQDFHVFKSYRDSLFRAKPFIGQMMGRVGGGTVEADAILKAWQRMLVQPEKRKLLLVLCDGAPGGHGVSDELDWSKHVCRTLEADDRAELACIGIRTAAPTSYFANCRVVSNTKDLPEAVFGILEGLIEVAHSKNVGKQLPKGVAAGRKAA